MSSYIKDREKIRARLTALLHEQDLEELALQIFQFQYKYNPVYQRFCDLLNRSLENVRFLCDIPYLPISFFKSHQVKSGAWDAEVTFGSSGTTGEKRSLHHIRDLQFYLNNAEAGFVQFFGASSQYCVLGYLPGYQERSDSSLIYMVNHLISKSDDENSGFYLNRVEELLKVLTNNKIKSIPTILFGVSFALLKLSKIKIDFPELIVIETGGMKNSQIEVTKQEIIDELKSSWNLNAVFSEYGMTELLSQSYSTDGKWYETSATKKVLIGELRDPLAMEKLYKTGIIKVLDLANYDTCSFIETEDLGMVNEKGYFQVLGRMDHAELRGCNLLLDDALKDPIR